ncbi:uncharacterized protein LOC135501142 [Lineus longissimus]|uniref:uncharacterized protein LOC135501142 n=1 Tax=Lineus longissimus TaxID=88925 RepID=UPI00315D1F55
MDAHDHPDSNEDFPLIPPIEPTPMTITLVMADSNRDPPRIPPPPCTWSGPRQANHVRSTGHAAVPAGAQAMAAQPGPGSSADIFSPIAAGQARTSQNMTSEGQQTVVVIALDMSDHTDYAFDHYMRHLHRPDNRIILVHSVSSPHLDVQMPSSGSGAPLSYVETSPDYLRDILQKKQDHISRVRQHFEQKIRALPRSVHYTFNFMSHSSTPGEPIIDIITRVRPSFVVLGSRGLGTHSRSVLSSVCQYVMNHTNTPVFICHQGEKNY